MWLLMRGFAWVQVITWAAAGRTHHGVSGRRVTSMPRWVAAGAWPAGQIHSQGPRPRRARSRRHAAGARMEAGSNREGIRHMLLDAGRAMQTGQHSTARDATALRW